MKLFKKIPIGYFVPPIIYNLIKFKSFYPKVEVKKIFIHENLGSYSQYQEDLILDCIFKSKTNGIFVDVGANDPENLSNTKRFYDNGWCGINIEPIPNLHEKFCIQRLRDINLNIGIGKECDFLTFYELEANTLSSFNREAALSNSETYNSKIIKEYKVEILPLKIIFEKYLKEPSIDFLSIDTEGYEMTVLLSNDWKKYRPYVILIELNQNEQEIISYLNSIGYLLVYNNFTNGIFINAQI